MAGLGTLVFLVAAVGAFLSWRKRLERARWYFWAAVWTIPLPFIAALAGWVIGLLWATFVVQIFLSIRRVYRQGWFFSIFKFFVGGFAYLIVLLMALAVTFFITLALP